MSRSENERQLHWLMAMRVVIVTTLLVCVFGIELLLRPNDNSLRPLFTLAAVAYGMSLTYAVFSRWLSDTRGFTLVQLAGDALLITVFVGFTGGVDSPMSFLYLLPISVGSMLMYRRGGLALAAVSWLLYGALVFAGAMGYTIAGFGGVRPYGEPGRVVYLLVAHLVAMVAFALLSSYLSERLRTQGRELRERSGVVARLKALNENIIDSINSGLVTTSLDGRVNFVNRGGTEILGLSEERIGHRAAEELFGLGAGFMDEIRRQLLARRRFRFERDFETGDGRSIFLGIAVSNLHDKSGSPLGHIFIFQDLTDIRALEQEMRLKERMVALGEMAAGMAHELRNPLAAISGSVQYLRGELDPTDEVGDLMDIILRESQRLDQAIRDFLTFARPGSYDPRPTDIVKLIEDNVKLLSNSPEFRRRHTIETRSAAPAIECNVDPNRIKQVFWNLASNALKAMPEGGHLAIDIREHEARNCVELNFADDGVGMDDEQRRRYFQPFNSSFGEGTGLGAAIVYRLVEEHGGRISLDSAKGGGTTVTIELPGRRSGHDTVETPRLAAAAGG